MIAIIAILASLLLPALAGAKEKSRRAVCLSNQRQLAIALHVYGGDHEERLPEGLRDNHVSHFSFISSGLHEWFLRRGGLGTNSLQCPNKRDWYRREPGVGFRLGYYYLFGHRTHLDTRPRDRDFGQQPHPWDSPQRLTDPPDWPLVADVVEKGTVTPPVTSAPHGPRGPVTSRPGFLPEPENLGSAGGHVALLDASVTWRQQRAMKPRHATIPRGRSSATGEDHALWSGLSSLPA